MRKTAHWTEASNDDYLFAVGFDFVEQLRSVMGDVPLSQKGLAEMLGLSEGRVSQVFNNPGNLTLSLMIEWSRHLGRKLGVVLYDDLDPENLRGPIEAEVFAQCWEAHGSPRNRGDLEVQRFYTLRVLDGKKSEESRLVATKADWCEDAGIEAGADPAAESLAS